ncbi:MAG: type II toxin-antitoxin system RelE/ParE family toxin [Deltaproteobacteria bacterium]|nr:type II toxin-antitoxin system RelE/ParE family toxin [Deltaproteobacteria bacterium]
MYKIIWTLRALKQLKKIDKNQQKKIVQGARQLTEWPKCRNIKALENHKYDYRLRVGRYRVFFNIEAELRITRIEEVKKRDGRSY